MSVYPPAPTRLIQLSVDDQRLYIAINPERGGSGGTADFEEMVRRARPVLRSFDFADTSR